MKINKTIYSIFKKGSKTYFYSTIFFPKKVKRDVFTLYSFLRKADDYVDSIPQDSDGFYAFKDRYHDSKSGSVTGDVVIDSFKELSIRKNFEDKWVDAFLNSMEMDIYKSTYQNLEELETYLYGSSEVVGLFMAKIMDLPQESFQAARHLGKAMQYINFIRDISEDIELGRVYFPQDDLESFGLENLEEKNTRVNEVNFKGFIKKQLETYKIWQKEAEKGFALIPYRYLISIKTASDMYNWTAREIENDPFVVYRRKVKPSASKVVFNVFSNSLGLSIR
ncbi:MAG: phytoene/squalene synthase family protein [Methanobacteriaceae archaeon]|jgi:phytoene synthase|nr:phytoene/squalene synthase family protein [Methanobacteriaceae archaeon]